MLIQWARLIFTSLILYAQQRPNVRSLPLYVIHRLIVEPDMVGQPRPVGLGRTDYVTFLRIDEVLEGHLLPAFGADSKLVDDAVRTFVAEADPKIAPLHLVTLTAAAPLCQFGFKMPARVAVDRTFAHGCVEFALLCFGLVDGQES